MSGCSKSKQCVDEGCCFHCGRKLKNGGGVDLDLNNKTGQFSSGGWNPEDSQGFFTFGADCAKKLDVALTKARGET